MTEAWTPGPWGVTTRRGSWDWVVYTEADSNIEICQPFHDGTDENEIGEANARLIAAAPELFEALVHARALLKAFTGPDDAIATAILTAAQNAIDKATGERGEP